MLDVLKQLFENNVVSEDIKAEIEGAWNNKIQENRDQVTAELREEFAQKFEHEKSQLVESLDKMLEDRLSVEIAEFVEDKKQLAEVKARYARRISEDASKLEGFVLDRLKSELVELHEDQKKMSSNFAKLEEFVVTQLAKEISEFYKDKQEVVETKVRLVKEAKSKLDEVKSRFVKNSAKLVEQTVVKTLKSEMEQLREDISSARQNDFGRRIFEAFASEYTHSYLNEKSEVAKMFKILESKEQEIAKIKSEVIEKAKIVESREREITQIRDMGTRKEIMNELLAPLGKDKRAVMSELLESVQTANLRKAYDKYLPAVMAEGTATKQALVEAKAVTGDKPQIITSEVENNIVDIRRLAGLK